MKYSVDDLISEARSVTEQVEKTFGDLNAEQINWKPDERSWSVGQCLEHLIITNKLEFPAIENALNGNHKNPFWSKVPLLPDLFGKTAIYICKPENTRKFKAPKSFRPSKSGVGENIVSDFVVHQQDLIRVFERSRNLDLQKIKIVTPISDFVTYSLHDSFLLLVVHEQRHFNQAKRVMETADCPT